MNQFIKYTLYRCARTICQCAIATIGSAALITDVDWRVVVSASLLAGLLSVLTSVATGLPEVEYAHHIHMNAEEPEDAEAEE